MVSWEWLILGIIVGYISFTLFVFAGWKWWQHRLSGRHRKAGMKAYANLMAAVPEHPLDLSKAEFNARYGKNIPPPEPAKLCMCPMCVGRRVLEERSRVENPWNADREDTQGI